MTKQLPPGWSIGDLMALPEVQEALEKARHQAHPVCGLWLDDNKGYMSGMQGKLKYWVFKNKNKEPGSKQPDYELCVSKLFRKPDDLPTGPIQRGAGGPAQRSFQGTAPMQAADAQARAPYNHDDDVPF